MKIVPSFTFSMALLIPVFFLSPPLALSSHADTSAPEVKTIEVKGLSSFSDEELLELLDIRTGEILDRSKVRAGIKRAFVKGVFDDIEVYSDEEGARIRIIVKEKDTIRKIRTVGNEYFSDREIKNMLLLKEGQVLRYDLLDENAQKLKQTLSERGFPDAVISVSVTPASAPYEKDLTIGVHEGKPLLMERVVVRGAPEDEINSIMHINEGEVYSLEAVKKDMERIRTHYRERDYLNPVVTYQFAEERLEVDVRKGRKLIVQFEGNTVFRGKRLMKEMPFLEAGEVRDDLIEDAARKIVLLYYGKGYPFAQVAPVISDAAGIPGDTTEVKFFIFEGEQVTVGSLNFAGVTLPEKKLKELLPLKEGNEYNPDLISADADIVREFYIALGYLTAEVEEPRVLIEENRADITISVKEGPRTLLRRVEVTGAVFVPPDELQQVVGLKQGDAYNEVDIADARARITEFYHERGFTDAIVNAQVEVGGEGALVTLEIEEGKKTFFGKTLITGNIRTRREVIERQLLHREGEPFNYGLLSRERQKLYKLGLFTDVRIERLDSFGQTADIRIDVTEGNAGTVDFGFGYSNYEKFTAFADFGYKNLFGMNRQASLKIGYNSLEKLYAINYLDPWFFDRDLQLKGILFHVQKEQKNIDTNVTMYRYKKTGGSLGIEKQYSSTTKGELYYEYVRAYTYDVQPDMILTPQDTGHLTISSLRTGVSYDTRDNPFDPRKGLLGGVTMQVAASALGSQTSFGKVIFNGSLYHELSRPFVLAVAFRFGLAQTWDSPSRILPLIERFFLGGRSTVRGYAQDTVGPLGSNNNPTGGNAFIQTNVELRTSVWKGLGVVTFLDSGNVWQKITDIDWSLKHTVGAGLRYDTPVGPFRLDYGYKLKRVTGLSKSEIFFSIGQAF
jgi:outer membrane protein insertion porin family